MKFNCAHVNLENYSCDREDDDNLFVDPVCKNCFVGLYALWKESLWEKAKERSGILFPNFGMHGRGKEAPQ
ncbi:MAG: hypothetical protein V3V92_00845 [Candidatus Hydrothermarchaeales archaeon]